METTVKDFNQAMNAKFNCVIFTLDKGFFHLHPMKHINTIYFSDCPDFIIPHIGEYISLFYNKTYKMFRVTSIWYDYKLKQIEVTVK